MLADPVRRSPARERVLDPDAPPSAPPAPASAPTPAGGRVPHVGSGMGRARGRHLRRRLAAFVVDTGLVSLAIFLGAAVLALTVGPAVELTTSDGSPVGLVVYDPWLVRATAVLGIVLCFAYFCVAWRLFGATAGQRLFGLALRDREGQPAVTIGGAALRWLALGAPLWIAASTAPGWAGIASAVALALWVLALLFSAARGRPGHGLHDRLSGTRVVRLAGERRRMMSRGAADVR